MTVTEEQIAKAYQVPYWIICNRPKPSKTVMVPSPHLASARYLVETPRRMRRDSDPVMMLGIVLVVLLCVFVAAVVTVILAAT